MIYFCQFRKQSYNNNITRPRSIQIVNVQVGCEHSSIVLIRAVFVNFATSSDMSWQKIKLVTNGNFYLLEKPRFWAAKPPKKLVPGICLPTDNFLVNKFATGTVPHSIMQFDTSRVYKKQRPRKFKPSPSAAQFSNLTTSARVFWTYFWTVSLPVIERKDARKGFIFMARCCIYGIVGEYIQQPDISSIGMYWYQSYTFRVQLYTRTLNWFFLTVLGWRFHSQFLGVFQLAYIPKFSRLPNSHITF